MSRANSLFPRDRLPPGLLTEPLELTGRILSASNATFLASIGDVAVVYKPIAGEKPLWDFPDGNLASREVAAFAVSCVFGGDVVPATWLRDGPHGAGMVQLWQECDPEFPAVDLVTADAIPGKGWRRAFEGYNSDDQPVVLIHEDSPALRRMALFDIVVNNADRKGGHILAMPDSHRHGVDHGLTFHEEHKLRTVLWGWMDEELTDEDLAAVRRVRAELSESLGDSLSMLLTDSELTALAERCDQLLASRTFPGPRGVMPAVPWPVF